jgi:hypothetical protein
MQHTSSFAAAILFVSSLSLFAHQGLKDARRCAFLGELDSVEGSDENSDEFGSSSEEFEVTDVDQKVTLQAGATANEGNSSGGEVTFRHHRASLNAMSKSQLVERLLAELEREREKAGINSEEEGGNGGEEYPAFEEDKFPAYQE